MTSPLPGKLAHRNEAPTAPCHGKYNACVLHSPQFVLRYPEPSGRFGKRDAGGLAWEGSADQSERLHQPSDLTGAHWLHHACMEWLRPEARRRGGSAVSR